MDPGSTYLILACIFAFLMAWGVGANDVANAMGTSVGSGALTIRQAIIIATLFEFTGAFLAGGEVTHTISHGIIDPVLMIHSPIEVTLGMMAALLAASTWLAIATYFGWPVSTTHTIIGAIVGFGALNFGMSAIQWPAVSSIILSWIFSPILGGSFAFGIFYSVQRFILGTDNPIFYAKRYIPFYMFFAGFIISLLTFRSGLSHLGIQIGVMEAFFCAFGIALIIAILGALCLRRIKLDPKADISFHFTNVERIFGILMIFTACSMAFAHGSNDVANAIGPLAAIVDIVQTGAFSTTSENALPTWVLALGAGGIVIGLITYGHKVIATLGKKITELTPSRGFSAELAAATTVVLASATGLPVSTTHTIVGAILGVGIARGISALNLSMIRTVLMSWIVTLPAGALLAIIFFHMLKWMLL